MKSRAGFCLILWLFAGSADAVIVGDRDWLQVTATTGNSWNDFDAIFDTASGSCDVAGCLLDGSLDLTGYTWASNADVNSLLESYLGSAGFDNWNTTQNIQVGAAALDSFFDDFDKTGGGSAVEYIYGFTRESIDIQYGTYIGVVNVIDVLLEDQLVLALNLPRDFAIGVRGGFLYRDLSPVPVPAAVWLFGTAILGLIGFGKRKARPAVTPTG